MKPLQVAPLSHPVTATVTIPGSKSYTNRALLMAAIAPQPITIADPLISDDTEAMIHCLQTLGIGIVRHQDSIEVRGTVNDVADQAYDLDVNLSGITIRFLTALACALPGVQTIHGKAGLNNRPIGDLVDGLRQLGASIEYLQEEGFPPLRVSSSKLAAGTVKMDGGVSSQYFSALLMVSPLLEGDLTIAVIGEQISKPYIDMTIDTMARYGVVAHNDEYQTYRVAAGQQYTTQQYVVEGDISSASYFFAIAALTGSTITTGGVNPQSKQADIRFLELLEDMGNTVTRTHDSITVVGKGIRLATVDMQDCPDQAMTMAVLAAFAPGTTVIQGVQSLRVKETERVVAIEQELAKMGIQTESTPNTLTIHGGKPHAATIDTYGDHRIAMAFAVAGTKLPGMVINNPEVVSKTFPEFWQVLAGIGAPPETKSNIVLIGMRGCGKTTVGELLAKRLDKQFVDMDSLIVERAGQAVPQIVAQHGWNHFRDLEATIAKETGSRTNIVLATGGGAILRADNVQALKHAGTLVLLAAKPTTLAARIQSDANRPPLTDKASLLEELQDVWSQRQDIYQQVADLTVVTDGQSPTAIADEVEQKLKAST